MRRVLVLVFCLLSFPVAAMPQRADLTTKDGILAWISTYRSNPEPFRVPAAMRGLAKFGLLRDQDGSGVYVGFLAGVLGANPARAEEIVTHILPLPAEYEWVIVRAIAYSGLPDWQALLRKVAPRMPGRALMIEKLIAGKIPTLEQAPIEKEATFGEKLRGQFALAKYFSKAPPEEVALDLTPEVLDNLWGYYFATGSYRPLSRIIQMLRWSKERDNLEKLTLAGMAKYTLALNASRNPDLLAQLRWAARQPQPEKIGPVLNRVVEAAETAETSRLRTEALAAVEELKRKGPGSKRDLSVWGQIGEGALAIGCIAAAVAGQVEFGVPCVIGGTAVSAGLRYFENQN